VDAPMKLSICVPTYNRFTFLKWSLAKLKALNFDKEIIISDDGSLDNTREIRHEGVRYFCQATNTGPFPNMRSALLAAEGEYAVFCADDDYLVEEGLARGIEYLDSHPEVSAYYAPCDLWDEVKGELVWSAYKFPLPCTFHRKEAHELFNFVIQHHVWPEHAIYRVRHLEAICKPRIGPYWAFLDVAHALGTGDVHFAQEPFYRNICWHPAGERVKLGDQQCLTDFDHYRAGLELMFCTLWGYINPQAPQIPQQARSRVQEMIRHFIFLRYEVAHRILTAQGRQGEAWILAQRMAVNLSEAA